MEAQRLYVEIERLNVWMNIEHPSVKQGGNLVKNKVK